MKALAASMILEPRACLFCFVGLLKRRCLLKECLLFNLPVPVTSKRLAAAFFVFNFGILIPFQLLEITHKPSGNAFSPEQLKQKAYNAFYFKFQALFSTFFIDFVFCSDNI